MSNDKKTANIAAAVVDVVDQGNHRQIGQDLVAVVCHVPKDSSVLTLLVFVV